MVYDIAATMSDSLTHAILWRGWLSEKLNKLFCLQGPKYHTLDSIVKNINELLTELGINTINLICVIYIVDLPDLLDP